MSFDPDSPQPDGFRVSIGTPQQKDRGGYWCVVCGRFLPADDCGVIVHDDVPHPEGMTFDEEERPQ